MKFFIALVALATLAIAHCANLEKASRPVFATGRIINGQEAKKGEAPYIVSLKSGSHFCAGSIIAANWVVTAGHCLVYSQFEIVAGLHSRNNETGAQKRQVTSSNQTIVHEKYSGSVGPYDIGLIYVAVPFNLTASNSSAPVAKVSLPSGKHEQTGKGKLYGWGRDNSGGLPNVLNTLEANIIDYSACKAALPAGDPVDPLNICSYTAGKPDGACNGDSGGPLVRNTKDGVELVGIVSWGYTPCATTKYPSVYTRTSGYHQWISEKIGNHTLSAL